MKTLRFSKTFSARVESVWKALVDSGSLSLWLMPTDFVAKEGADFLFSEPGFYVSGKVIEIVENRRLSLLWVSRKRKDDGESGSPSIVTWKLSPTRSGGTRLELEQEFVLDEEPVVLIEMNLNWRFAIWGSLSGFLQAKHLPVPIVYAPDETESEEVKNRRAGFRKTGVEAL